MVENKTSNCGFVMPISGFGNYTAEHWAHQKELLCSIVRELNLGESEIVSTHAYIPDIKSSIFNNLFTLPVVIVDVSGNNPNVLFELGLRVAFDMPIVIIKDKQTVFNFDIASLFTIEYPDDLLSRPVDDLVRMNFCTSLKNRIWHQFKGYMLKDDTSPLKRYLDDAHYLQMKRGVPFDIAGYFEYKCIRDEIGYQHGGWCIIQLVHSRGNVMEWSLTGNRCWSRASADEPFITYALPFRWSTTHAIIFPDKTYMLNYKIKGPRNENIEGVIQGTIELAIGPEQEVLNRVDDFNGSYYQDEGANVVKGRFVMERVSSDVRSGDYVFKLKK